VLEGVEKLGHRLLPASRGGALACQDVDERLRFLVDQVAEEDVRREHLHAMAGQRSAQTAAIEGEQVLRLAGERERADVAIVGIARQPRELDVLAERRELDAAAGEVRVGLIYGASAVCVVRWALE